MMGNISTYGELLQEIERVENTIKEIQHQPSYEYGDELDFELYLISLKKTKKKNEQRYKLLQDFGLYECSECGSIHLNFTQDYNIRLNSYNIIVDCQDCKHQEHKTITKQELKEYIPPEGEFDWLVV